MFKLSFRSSLKNTVIIRCYATVLSQWSNLSRLITPTMLWTFGINQVVHGYVQSNLRWIISRNSWQLTWNHELMQGVKIWVTGNSRSQLICKFHPCNLRSKKKDCGEAVNSTQSSKPNGEHPRIFTGLIRSRQKVTAGLLPACIARTYPKIRAWHFHQGIGSYH